MPGITTKRDPVLIIWGASISTIECRDWRVEGIVEGEDIGVVKPVTTEGYHKPVWESGV